MSVKYMGPKIEINTIGSSAEIIMDGVVLNRPISYELTHSADGMPEISISFYADNLSISNN